MLSGCECMKYACTYQVGTLSVEITTECYRGDLLHVLVLTITDSTCILCVQHKNRG